MGVPMFKKNFLQMLGPFEIKEPTPEIAEKLKANIARQDEIMRVIKLRAEKFFYNCGLLIVGTGVGKSILAIKITQYHECNTLILVSNKILLSEMFQKFLEFAGVQVGIY